jgi:glutathione synthase
MMPPVSILWITDPWSTLTHSQDTTLRLADEAQKLGIATYWSGTDFIFDESSASKTNQLKVVSVTTDFITQTENSLLQSSVHLPTSKFHQIHYRVDPPVDLNYISAIDKLMQKGVQEKQILNPVKLITQHSEKIPPADLIHLAPKLAVVHNAEEARAAFARFQNEIKIVTKPLNLAQSIGVKQWDAPKTEGAFVSLLKTETSDWTTPILVEEFLPDIAKGEVRMWFAFGKFIAALKKFPKDGDFRVLIDEGSVVKAYMLNAEEEKLAQEVGLSLKKAGVALAAIDFISGKICDYNLTSPGLLIQLEAVHQKNFAKEVILALVENIK